MQPRLEGIKAMLISKAERHEAVWQHYVAGRDAAKQNLELTAAQAAEHLKVRVGWQVRASSPARAGPCFSCML